MEDQPPLTLSLAAHTHSKTHAQVHMPVSCLRLYSKSDSLLPAFPSQPYCFVSRCSIGARSHKTLPEKGLHQQPSPSAFQLFNLAILEDFKEELPEAHAERDLTN